MNDKDLLIEQLIKEKGGTVQDYYNIMNSIAYHESAHSNNPNIVQIGGGPGRGKYQFEEGDHMGGITAANRTRDYFKQVGIPIPQWLEKTSTGKSLDATTLTSDQQDILFLGNMRGHPTADFKNVIDGKESIPQFWAKYHWAGKKSDYDDRLKSFMSSYDQYNQLHPKQVEDEINNNPEFYKNSTDERFNPKYIIQDLYRSQQVQDRIQPIIPQRVQSSHTQPQQFNADQYISQNQQSNPQFPSDNNSLNHFNGGGTHEENPLGGIPQGNNSVESGETSFKLPQGKFIFSDRIGTNGQIQPKLDGAKQQVSNSYNNQFAYGGLESNTGCGGSGQPPCPEKESYGIKDFAEYAYQAWFNPKNYGVKDYTSENLKVEDGKVKVDKLSFGNAYQKAKKQKKSEFIWNNKRYPTDVPKSNFINKYIANNTYPYGNLFTNEGDFKIDYEDLMKAKYYDKDGTYNPENALNFKRKDLAKVSKNSKGLSYEEFSKNRNRSSNWTGPKDLDASYDALSIHQNQPQKYNSFRESKYKPSISKVNNDKYYSFNDKYEKQLEDDLLLYYNRDFIESKEKKRQTRGIIAGASLKNYQYSKGEDKRGQYVAYYDKNDYGNILDIIPNANPFEIYGRIYYKDYGDGKNKRMYYTDKELSELNIDKKDFDTLALQRELSNRGYEIPKSTKQDGSFDGIWGDETKNALLEYRKSQSEWTEHQTQNDWEEHYTETPWEVYEGENTWEVSEEEVVKAEDGLVVPRQGERLSDSECGGEGQPPCPETSKTSIRDLGLFGENYSDNSTNLKNFVIDNNTVGDESVFNPEKSRSEMKEYLNSEGFINILKKQYSEEEALAIKNDRLSKLKTMKITSKSQLDDRGPGWINGLSYVPSKEEDFRVYNPYFEKSNKSGVELEKYGYTGIPRHEYNHYITDNGRKLSNRDFQEISNRVTDNTKQYFKDDLPLNRLTNKTIGYYDSPTEVQARVVDSRLHMKENNIYDYNKEEFDYKHLNKLKKHLKTGKVNQSLIDLLENVNSDQDFIWLMNNIAKTSKTVKDNKNIV